MAGPDAAQKNPFESRQRPEKDKTIKWCAWEVLNQLGKPAGEEEIGAAITAGALRSNVRWESIGKELASDRKHFVREGAQWALAPPRAPKRPSGDDGHPSSPAGEPAGSKAGAKRRRQEVQADEIVFLPPRKSQPVKAWWTVPGGQQPAEETAPSTQQPGGEEEGSGGDDEEEAGGAGPARLEQQQQQQQQAAELMDAVPPVPPAASDDESSLDIGQPAAVAAATADAPAALPSASGASMHAVQPAAEKEVPAARKPEAASSPPPAPAPAAAPEPPPPQADAAEERAAAEHAPPSPPPPAPPPEEAPPPSFTIPKRQAAAPPAPAAAKKAAPFVIPKASHSPSKPADRQREAGPSQRREEPRREEHARQAAPPRAPAAEPRRAAAPPPRQGAPMSPWEQLEAQDPSSLDKYRHINFWDPAYLARVPVPVPADPATISEATRAEWAEVDQLWAFGPDGTPCPKTFREAVPVDPFPPVFPHPELTSVRIMQCSNATERGCLERGVFVSNHQADTDGIVPNTTLILLHNFDKRVVRGCYVAREVGTNLDRSWGREWPYQVRVEPARVFSPLPSEMLEPWVPRRTNPKDGKPMKFFEKGCSDSRDVWRLFELFGSK